MYVNIYEPCYLEFFSVFTSVRVEDIFVFHQWDFSLKFSINFVHIVFILSWYIIWFTETLALSLRS
jgi:hypothetical protein